MKIILNLGITPAKPQYNTALRGWADSLNTLTGLTAVLSRPPADLVTACDNVELEQQVLLDFEQKIKKQRDKLHAAEKNREDITRIVLSGIEGFVAGDAAKASATGTKVVTSKPGTSAKPNKPVINSIADGDSSGTIRVILTAPAENATTYQVQYTTNYGKPEAQTVLYAAVFTNSRKIELVGLPKATEIAVEVRGNSSKGSGAWSDVHFKVVA
jgi:hypothetical protein